MPDERVERALAALDRAIAAAPARDGAAFSEATGELTPVRDEMAARGRGTPEQRRRLTALNAVLSLVMAGHFPLGVPPWEDIRKARGWLADLGAEI